MVQGFNDSVVMRVVIEFPVGVVVIGFGVFIMFIFVSTCCFLINGVAGAIAVGFVVYFDDSSLKVWYDVVKRLSVVFIALMIALVLLTLDSLLVVSSSEKSLKIAKFSLEGVVEISNQFFGLCCLYCGWYC